MKHSNLLHNAGAMHQNKCLRCLLLHLFYDYARKFNCKRCKFIDVSLSNSSSSLSGSIESLLTEDKTAGYAHEPEYTHRRT